MAFHCQRDSYASEFETKVKSCKAASITRGKKDKVAGFEVILDDTILFPEGGGQNWDHGWINDSPVIQVTRRGDLAVHFVQANHPLDPGAECRVRVDWPRRFDHMQQHTGQHLISVMLELKLDISTLSWWMAESEGGKVGVSYIELDKELTDNDLMLIQDECNKCIRDHLNVSVQLHDKDDPNLDKAHTRGLPDDFSGPIRVIHIGQIDSNMCCGTHVANLAELQVVKLLNVEKKKGKHYLNFLVGDRVIQFLDQSFRRERAMTAVLNGGPEDHLDLATKAVKGLKVASKSVSNLLKEMAINEAKTINSAQPKAKYVILRREEGGADFINVVCNEVHDKSIFLCVIVGDEQSGSCSLTMTGNESDVQALGPKIIQLLEGKGGGKGSRMNAKVKSLKSMNQVQAELKLYFTHQS